ncbi:MAG: response regulator [Ferruginibacter sp.]
MNDNPLLLIVDDDPDDIVLLKEAIHSIDETIAFAEANNGLAAMKMLQTITDPLQLPSLIVLDINMPVLNGRELLAILKNENKWKSLPVVVFSTSSYPGDVAYCRQFGVELITKPFGMKELLIISGILIGLLK